MLWLSSNFRFKTTMKERLTYSIPPAVILKPFGLTYSGAVLLLSVVCLSTLFLPLAFTYTHTTQACPSV